LLVIGIILSVGIYGASAANVGSGSTGNISLSHFEGSDAKIVSQTIVKSTSSKPVSKSVSTSRKVIKVVIYNGRGAINSCVLGVKTGLHTANTKNLLNGYYFSYSTTKTINYSILSHYNVLVMPGGLSGKNYINCVSSSAIRKFVRNGHGYLGICAGAYAGSRNVDGLYKAWGVAPHVYCKHPYHEGNLKVKILYQGSKLFGSGGTVTMAHYNGPAMYVKGGQAVTFAVYADNHIGYKNYGAIVGDYYYLGRSILSGPHPELDPQHPSILARLVAWTAKVPVINGLAVSMSSPSNGAVDVSPNQLLKITFNKPIKFGNNLISLKTSSGNSIAITKSISNNVLSLRHKLLGKGVRYIVTLASGSVTDLSGKAISYYSTSFRVSSLTTAQIMDGISRVQKFYITNHRLPNYVTFGTRKILINNFIAIIGAYGLKINY
jgi:glutamine amidotransferase-like uncharacterized protein